MLGQVARAIGAAEYGRWKHWYAGEWLTNVNRRRETIALYAQHLADALSPLPSPLPGDGEAYDHIVLYEGDRAVGVRADRASR